MLILQKKTGIPPATFGYRNLGKVPETMTSNGIAFDSSNNMYVTGGGTLDAIIVKYNSSGTLEWQKTASGASDIVYEQVKVDSTGSIYTICTDSSGFVLVKYNNSGSIVWQRRLGSGNSSANKLTIDSLNNIYITGTYENDMLIAKYNSSGVIQWQRTLDGGGLSAIGFGLATDSSNNVYLGGYAYGHDIIVVKYNPSGVIQWQRKLASAAHDQAYALVATPAGDVYVSGHTRTTGSQNILLAKYNTSGTIQWQRTLIGTGSEVIEDIDIDTSGNVYIGGRTNSQGAGSYDMIVAKYNSSGVIQWQRVIGGSSNEYGNAITVNGNAIYIAGYSQTSPLQGFRDISIVRLPSTLTLPETRGVFTVSAATLTESALTLTDSTATLTDASSSLTEVASTLSEGTAAYNEGAANWS